MAQKGSNRWLVRTIFLTSRTNHQKEASQNVFRVKNLFGACFKKAMQGMDELVFGEKIARDRFLWKNPDWKYIQQILAIWMRYSQTGIYFEYEIEEKDENYKIFKEFIRIVDPDILKELKDKIVYFEPCGAIKNAIVLGYLTLSHEAETGQNHIIPKELIEEDTKNLMVLTTLDEWKQYIYENQTRY